MKAFVLLFLPSLSAVAFAESSAQKLYGQCGGENWTGATTCVSGAHCVAFNPWYSQCVAVAAETEESCDADSGALTSHVSTVSTKPVPSMNPIPSMKPVPSMSLVPSMVPSPIYSTIVKATGTATPAHASAQTGAFSEEDSTITATPSGKEPAATPVVSTVAQANDTLITTSKIPKPMFPTSFANASYAAKTTFYKEGSPVTTIPIATGPAAIPVVSQAAQATALVTAASGTETEDYCEADGPTTANPSATAPAAIPGVSQAAQDTLVPAVSAVETVSSHQDSPITANPSATEPAAIPTVSQAAQDTLATALPGAETIPSRQDSPNTANPSATEPAALPVVSNAAQATALVTAASGAESGDECEDDSPTAVTPGANQPAVTPVVSNAAQATASVTATSGAGTEDYCEDDVPGIVTPGPKQPAATPRFPYVAQGNNTFITSTSKVSKPLLPTTLANDSAAAATGAFCDEDLPVTTTTYTKQPVATSGTSRRAMGRARLVRLG